LARDFWSALKSISRNDTLPVDVVLLSYIKATELLSLSFCKLTSSIQYRARSSVRSPPWLDAPSVSLEARPETRTDASVLRTSSFGGSSSSRPSAYKVSNPRMESEGRKTYQTMSTWCTRGCRNSLPALGENTKITPKITSFKKLNPMHAKLCIIYIIYSQTQ